VAFSPKGDAGASLGWRDRAGATWQPRIKWLWDPKIPLRWVNPGRRRLSRSSGALPFGLQAAGASWTPTLGVARRHADQVCVVGAPKSVSPKRSRKRDWHTGFVDARARPEGKTVTVTIVGGPTTRSYEQRPPGRPGCPNCREAIARRSGRLQKKPGESGSDRSLTALIRKRTRDDGRSGDRPLGRFGFRDSLRVRSDWEMRG
jgi:hypothetical protein